MYTVLVVMASVAVPRGGRDNACKKRSEQSCAALALGLTVMSLSLSLAVHLQHATLSLSLCRPLPLSIGGPAPVLEPETGKHTTTALNRNKSVSPSSS